MFYTILYKRRKRKWLKAKALRIDKMIWDAEVKESAARDLIENGDRDIVIKKDKIAELEKFIKEEQEKEKCDMDNIKKMIEQKSKVKKVLEEVEKGRMNLLKDIGVFTTEQQGARQYQKLIRKMSRE